VLDVAKTLPNGDTLVKAQKHTAREPRREHLTDRKLRSLKASDAGVIYDGSLPGFGVRISDKALLTFILVARYPGSSFPARRRLGRYPMLSLADARKKAGTWLELIQRGTDPEDEARSRQVEMEKAKKAEQLRQANSVPARIDEFLRQPHVRDQRQIAETTRILRKELAAPWGDKLLHDITRRDVKNRVSEIADRGSPAMARNVLTAAKVFFEWAVDEEYLDASPAAGISPKKVIGERAIRDRVLQDDELVAFWRATEAMAYPFGPLYRLLLLTGARLNEIGGARWGEIDFETKVLTVPPERFKSRVAHIIPLSGPALATLSSLPRLGGGDYLFSFKSGKSPIHSFSVGKERLDKLMAKELGSSPPPFVIHDLRRTVRTRLSSLKVGHQVAELVIGHGKRGLDRVYDQHSFLEEMRDALELWAGRLQDITTPPPDNVARHRITRAR
jgi:integrase